MQHIDIDLEHCYGIRRLETRFEFNNCSAVALYAPNGAMKSSLAKTFEDIANGKKSKDRIFPERETRRSVTDDAGKNLEPDSVLVVRPYDEQLANTEKSSTLLVNRELRTEYEKLNEGVEGAKKVFLKAMREQSTSKKDIEKEISSTFSASEDKFIQSIMRISDEVIDQKEFPFSSIPYDVVFDDKVIDALSGNDMKLLIEEYITNYNNLIDKSAYFKRGMFTYYNASVIAKTLADNGFFDAKHSISLNGKEAREIDTRHELEELVRDEKEGISSDPDLRTKFEAIEKSLYKNANVRNFHTYITNHEELLPALANVAEFKEQVWKSYIGEHLGLFKDLISEIRGAEKRRKEIEDTAKKESTDWEEVIKIFNSRFFVPFELVVTNRLPVMLGTESIPKLGFIFHDGTDTQDVDRNSLLEVLSTGEKKAFYILNIIFDIQVRLKTGQKTLMVIDDVADSFDYKNKYAIVQYLKDISESPDFRQVILTHNFDFFRTIQSRFVAYNCCFMVARKKEGVMVEKAVGIKNIFVNDWKPNFGQSAKKRIASIPFMRNLVEFTIGETAHEYMKLTSLLHLKPETVVLTEADLFEIYRKLFNSDLQPNDGGGTSVLDLIYKEADACLVAHDGANFENKIVLSIATRLKVEQYMIDRINDPDFVAGIKKQQTTALLRKFKEYFASDADAISAVDKVLLMTPENIHLNSFMYEPILDMSDEHLRNIYCEVSNLQVPAALAAS